MSMQSSVGTAMRRTPLLDRLLDAYDEECRMHGTPEERALDYVRELFRDPEIHMDQIRPKSALDYLRAQRSDECRSHCPGRTNCPHKGRVFEVMVLEQQGYRTYLPQLLRCSEFTGQMHAENVSRLLSASGIPESFLKCSFGNFTTEGLKPDIRVAKGVARECSEDGTWLLLHGKATGTGKTHLAAALLKAQITRGRSGVFVNARDLSATLHQAIATREVETRMRRFKSPQCLVIDDIGVQNDGEWLGRQLYEIVNERYEQRRQTVVTSNARNMTELSAMCGSCGDRIVSRLTELAHTLEIHADDYRLHKGQRRLFENEQRKKTGKAKV